MTTPMPTLIETARATTDWFASDAREERRLREEAVRRRDGDRQAQQATERASRVTSFRALTGR